MTALASTSAATAGVLRPSQRTRIWRWGALIAAFVFALVFPFTPLAAPPWLNTCVFIVALAIGALGLNVLTGYTGQVSLGHAFFLAVGAYTAAVLGGQHGLGGTRGYGLTAAIWIPAAGAVAGLCGLVVGPTALRLRGLYLAIVTIGLVFIGQHIWSNVSAISGGPAGRSLPSVSFGSFDFAQQQDIAGFTPTGGATAAPDALYYYLSLFILAVSMMFVWNLTRTRLGRAMQAVREREIAASLMGVHIARTKVAAFVISSFLAGVAGALYGSAVHYAVPGTWDLILSIQFVAIIIVGGVGTVSGALLGSIFVGALPFALQQYSADIPFIRSSAGGSGIAPGDAAAIMYGALIIAFLVLEPRGLVGLGGRARRLIPSRRGIPVSHHAPRPQTAATAISDTTAEGSETS